MHQPRNLNPHLRDQSAQSAEGSIVVRALNAARQRVSPQDWAILSGREQTRAIYQEMRRIDLEEAAARADPRAKAAQTPAQGL